MVATLEVDHCRIIRRIRQGIGEVPPGHVVNADFMM